MSLDARDRWISKQEVLILSRTEPLAGIPFMGAAYAFRVGLVPADRMFRFVKQEINRLDEVDRLMGRPTNWKVKEDFEDALRHTGSGRPRIAKQLGVVRHYAREGYLDRGVWLKVHEAHRQMRAEMLKEKQWRREQEKHRAAMEPIRHQRRKLREGKETLTAIRRHLRDRQPLQLAGSGPGRTSQTS